MLAPKKYPGLLVTPADKEQALYKGLLGLGAQLSQGYTDKPTSFMGNLGQAGLGFQKGYGDQIALTKADQLQNMQAQSAQASLEAQKMKIAEAARLKKQQEAEKQAAMRYLGSQGQYSPNMMDASGIEQTMDTRNVTGAMQLNPLEQIQVNTGQGYKVLEGIEAIKASSALKNQEFERQVELENIRQKNKPPSMDWVVVDGKPKLVAKTEIARLGLPKYEKSNVKSPEELEQSIQIAQATAGAKPITDAQAKSGTFALRMKGARSNLNNVAAGVDGKLGTADDYVPSRKDTAVFDAPFGNQMVTNQYRQYRQAQDDWISANLRKESGAVIGVEEMVEERKKYFPQPGDDSNTVVQKAKSRKAAEAAMKVASGRAYNEMLQELGGQNPFEGFEVVEK
tara:strand:- start:2805 stop:3992 length:1188 start_codon:yes stop_codon:yes gene_type:complete